MLYCVESMCTQTRKINVFIVIQNILGFFLIECSVTQITECWLFTCEYTYIDYMLILSYNSHTEYGEV